MKPLSTTDASIPLAKAFHISQLNGWASKWLEIPAGRNGLALFRDGRSRQAAGGRQTLLTFGERLRGLGAGLRAGYYPTQPFQAWLRAANLLSGDQQLVDCSLLCHLKVNQPLRFFNEVLWQRGELLPGDLDFSGEDLATLLNALVNRYTATDLVSGLPSSRLLPEVQTLLQPGFAAKGLELEGIALLIFQRAEDRLTIAQKAQDLQQRLRDLALDAHMAEIESQAQLQDFVHQLNAELGPSGALHLGELPLPGEQAMSASPAEQQRRIWLGSLEKWAKNELEKAPKPWRIGSLWKKKELEEPPPAPQPLPPGWWLARLVWMAVLILAGIFLTRLVTKLASNVGWLEPWELVSLVWALVIGGVFDSLKHLYERRERIYESLFNPPKRLSLHDLARNDRLKLDAMVRQQARQDLLHSREILADLRSQVYRQGQETLALQIKSLEGKFERQAENLLRQDNLLQGFLQQIKIERQVWEQWLSNDEAFLARSAALADDAQALRQAFHQGAFHPNLVDRLEARLDALMHIFESRQRVFQANPQTQSGYQDALIQRAG